ncbi:hypothetical protein [Jiella sp. M17.18]|uniref:hypothetical protein n=1 Tax=Jiella sp. M17.18 TaxID=3234247 RepID=UPI0034DF0B6C
MDYEKFRLEHSDEFPSAPAEEIKSARRDVKAQKAAYDWLASVIGVVTAGLAAAVLAATTLEPIVGVLRRIFGS